MRAANVDARFAGPLWTDSLAPLNDSLYASSSSYRSLHLQIGPGVWRVTRAQIPANDRFWISWSVDRPKHGLPYLGRVIPQAGLDRLEVTLPAGARWLHVFDRLSTEPTALRYRIERIG